MTQSVTYGSPNRTVAMYKGVKVAVYSVDKTELSLTRTDLIELINVRTLLIDLFSHLAIRLFILLALAIFIATSISVQVQQLNQFD